ncbi:PepSY domain-containing protein [Alcaligenaceae bacterium]|nr:PepSY domain-containing protein [Alcaligenaceae bacterium]
MRTSKFLATCALGTSLLAGGAVLTSAYAQSTAPAPVTATTVTSQANTAQATTAAPQHMKHERYAERMKNVDTSQWLGIKAVYDKVEAAGYKDVGSIRRTSKGYKVSAANADGQWTHLRVDPIKGDITQMQKKDKHEGRGDGHHGSKHNKGSKTY